ncbi:hypothetical protein [Polyangium jinanense]|uniref:Uncharacterized protein n=1 Tax=Polyangium jinanense TaxID=2829994 RepID=A0A9X3WYM1_9BACT|nr:hypothetical protein [Polyangium jinanense]MDC3979630.1 hypothetical protein [Polyangium jinanense]
MMEGTSFGYVAVAASLLALSGCGEAGEEAGSVAEEAEALTATSVKLKSVNTGNCMRATETFVRNGNCGDSLLQRWDIFRLSGGFHAVRSVGLSNAMGESMCMTVVEPSPGDLVTMQRCDRSVNSQQWRISTAAPHAFSIAYGGSAQSGVLGTPIFVTTGMGASDRWDVVP